MKRFYAIIFLWLVFALTVSARLGESPRECARRYGAPISRRSLKGRDGFECKYERGNFEITIRFVRSKKTVFNPYEAGYLCFQKTDHSEFDRKTVEKILKKNCSDQVLFAKLSRDMYWKEIEDVEQEDIDKEWMRVYRYNEFENGKKVEKEGYAKARANLSEDNVLVLTSHFPLPRGYDDWEERQEEESKQEDDKSTVQDFF